MLIPSYSTWECLQQRLLGDSTEGLQELDWEPLI